MQVFNSVNEMQNWCLEQKRSGKKIGLVPTMGYLHEGHLTLVREAVKSCDVVVVSIFVNPMQFGQGEDFEQYPRDLTRDLSLLEKENIDAVFAPLASDMYPKGYSTSVEVTGHITSTLCGRSRPGHFKGVTTVVSKLFNICQPDEAFFGQKDVQQVVVIEKMVRELNFPIKIVRVPIVRESDGLAMSSRNVYLNPEQRQQALVLSKSLNLAKELIEKGERDAATIKAAMENLINSEKDAVIDYVQIVNDEDLADVDVIKDRVLIAIAVKFGSVRLIDNLLVEV